MKERVQIKHDIAENWEKAVNFIPLPAELVLYDGIIEDGENGFICDPGNEDELISIYRRIKGLTVQERNEIGQRAIDLAIHYSEREVAERYLQDVLSRNN